jgi:hypothetical protein
VCQIEAALLLHLGTSWKKTAMQTILKTRRLSGVASLALGSRALPPLLSGVCTLYATMKGMAMKTAAKGGLAAALAAVAFLGAFAADEPTPREIQQREMKKLDWLVGRWKGAGWILMGPQGRHEFTQTETIEAKLDGLVLVIEGLGKAKEDASTVHAALAFVSYDHRAKTFRWHAITPEGQIDTVAKIGTNTLEWGLQIPQRGRMRYTITRNEKGEWFEIGEMIQEDQTGRKFFEMTLRREK